MGLKISVLKQAQAQKYAECQMSGKLEADPCLLMAEYCLNVLIVSDNFPVLLNELLLLT